MNPKAWDDAIGEIDSTYVDEAIRYRGRKRRPAWIRCTAAAACLCLILSGALLYRAEHRYPLREVTDISDSSVSEMAEVPRWGDMEIYEQYSEITVDGLTYQAGWGEVPSERLGTQLATVSARGWDEYADLAGQDANRYCDAAVYEMIGISSRCAVAVKYEGSDICYCAVNSFYRPGTLGQFIEDLDLQHTLTVNWASYEYHKPLSGPASILFENLDADRFWDLLLSGVSAENEYDDLDFDLPDTILDVCVSVPMLGYENISVSIREEGYIITNILSTGKMFYVGEENTQAFVDYVLNECDGYEIVYVTQPDDSAVPE